MMILALLFKVMIAFHTLAETDLHSPSAKLSAKANAKESADIVANVLIISGIVLITVVFILIIISIIYCGKPQQKKL